MRDHHHYSAIAPKFHHARNGGGKLEPSLERPSAFLSMTLAKDLESANIGTLEAEQDGVVFPPGDLYSDEPPLESDLHRDQIDLLIRLIKWFWRDRQDFYVSGNLTVYYSPAQKKSEDFRGPDFFVVLNTDPAPRKSWVVWEEGGKYPHVIVELLSDSTASTDRGLKKQIYQDIFRTLDYFWFDPVTLEFQGFHLVDGQYEELPPNAQGQRWSQQLQLHLGVHQNQLRFFTVNGELILTPEETAIATEALLARYQKHFGNLPPEK